MSKFKKVLLTGLSLALVAVLAIGGTMAYLTSTDSDMERIMHKMRIASDISRISGRPSVMIVEKDRGLSDVRFTAVVTKDELRKIDDKDDLTDMVMSRSKVE